jgi:hypothetical protein
MKALKDGETKLNNNYILDREYTDQYYPAIKQAITQSLDLPPSIKIDIAPDLEDMEQATDYIVKLTGNITIACRIRRPNCLYRDFTIRGWRITGAKTEHQKLKEGFAQYYLYAWAKDKQDFADWIFLCLDKFRKSGLLDRPHELIKNPDGTTGFYHYKLAELYLWDVILARGGT